MGKILKYTTVSLHIYRTHTYNTPQSKDKRAKNDKKHPNHRQHRSISIFKWCVI